MADEEDPPVESAEKTPKKKSKQPLILGLVLALAGGGVGFYATFSGMILGSDSRAAEGGHDSGKDDHVSDHSSDPAIGDIAFVAVDPMVVSMGLGADAQHLRFRAQLEVPTQYQADVEKLLPRVVDVLNSYLRALEVSDLADAAALVRLRAQMLRRIQIVIGTGRVNDLLIMEFVLN
ncbi:flagellar basal body-associated FliL family protein [Marimonas arenosa]|uniref:Flagellar protein FliL n=1 Tax=Marimonas arenosa TaxID=1795305 RepID=A0AAE3WF52_9RHOB|nr:flagellar basal body-associated FliL family protein [Marimonas arenosa]MDQ2090572.1 flagellar basal body-associated FliL family protein [Marimonas arenosa]